MLKMMKKHWLLLVLLATWGAGVSAYQPIVNAMLASMSQATIKGRASGAGTGVPVDLTATQATAILNAFVGDSGSGGTKGLVPAPSAGDAAAGKFLSADGTFKAPSTSGAAAARSVLTKTANYTILTGDFNSAKQLMVECNCTTECTLTLPAASNSGYDVAIVNVGAATCNVITAGSDKLGGTDETTTILPPGNIPNASGFFIANGGSRWAMF